MHPRIKFGITPIFEPVKCRGKKMRAVMTTKPAVKFFFRHISSISSLISIPYTRSPARAQRSEPGPVPMPISRRVCLAQ